MVDGLGVVEQVAVLLVLGNQVGDEQVVELVGRDVLVVDDESAAEALLDEGELVPGGQGEAEGEVGLDLGAVAVDLVLEVEHYREQVARVQQADFPLLDVHAGLLARELLEVGVHQGLHHGVQLRDNRMVAQLCHLHVSQDAIARGFN